MDPTADSNYAIRVASRRGWTEIVKLLLQCEKVDPMWGSTDIKSAFSETLCSGNMTIMKLLLNSGKVNLSGCGTTAISKALNMKNIEMAKLLLMTDGINPADNNNSAIQLAAWGGYVEIVELLLKFESVDPSADNNYAIKSAFNNRHLNVVKLLLASNKINLENIDNPDLLAFVKKIQSPKKRLYIKQIVSLMKELNILAIKINAEKSINITRIISTNDSDPTTTTKIIDMMKKYDILQVDITNGNMFVYGDISS